MKTHQRSENVYQPIIRFDEKHQLWVLDEAELSNKYSFLWGIDFSKTDQVFILTNKLTQSEAVVSVKFPLLPFAS